MELSNGKVIACAQTSQECDEFLNTLPKLSFAEVPPGDSCPICLIPFSTILEEEYVGTSNTPEERLGITQLQCGHVFCMSDIAVWIHTSRGSCPTCRDLFLIIPEPSDDESSDGGEYIPGSDSAADEMMDYDTWTDEEAELWADSEEMSPDEGTTEGESDSWDRSSEDVTTDLAEEGVSAPGQLRHPWVDPAVIANAEDGHCLTVPHADVECEQIKTELMQWRAQIEPIQIQEWLSDEQETRLRIHEGICVLEALKPRIDSIERDTSAKVSFVHYALATIREIRALMDLKLEMIQRGDFVASDQQDRS